MVVDENGCKFCNGVWAVVSGIVWFDFGPFVLGVGRIGLAVGMDGSGILLFEPDWIRLAVGISFSCRRSTDAMVSF